MSDETNTVQEETANPFEQLSALLESIEQHPDAEFRDRVRELVYSVIELHHGALRRILAITAAQADGEETLKQLSEDDLVRAVLMVHGLMPQDLESRVLTALEHAREHLKPYDADVELVGIRESVARLRLVGGAASANVSTAVLKGAIEQALHELAPDLFNVEYEDLIATAKPRKLVQIAPKPLPAPPKSKGNLIPVIRANEVPNNELRVIEMGDINLVICNVAGTFYAFHNHCPHRGESLQKGMLEGPVLTCPWHGYQFDLRHGGRCLTDPALRLNALPITVENEVVRVALQAEASNVSESNI
ncbi:MAG: Rieske 2Fe-2S domain-containing protein [Blastocatellia bacterium]